MVATTIVRKMYEFNKAVLTTSVGTAKNVISVVADGVGNATGAARDAGATVVGQTRSAVDRTVEQAATGAKEVTGQARAQGRQASAKIDRVATRTADRAIDVVDDAPSSGTPYESWTKDDLYQRAQELDIDGRSTMSKKELIAALRSS